IKMGEYETFRRWRSRSALPRSRNAPTCTVKNPEVGSMLADTISTRTGTTPGPMESISPFEARRPWKGTPYQEALPSSVYADIAGFGAAALRFGADAGALPRLPSALSDVSAGCGCDGAGRLALVWREAQPERKQT